MAACPRCHTPLPNKHLVTFCVECLNAIYLERVREREREAFAGEANPMVELAKVRGTLQQHVVMRTDRDYVYCGAKPVGPKKNWTRMRLNLIPKVCEQCKAAIEALQQV